MNHKNYERIKGKENNKDAGKDEEKDKCGKHVKISVETNYSIVK